MFGYSRSQAVGYRAEQWIGEQLEARGYHVKFDPDWFNKGFDLTINGIPCEVKFANRTDRFYRNQAGLQVVYPRWQFCICPTSHHMQNDWLLILIAQAGYERYIYIVPGALVNNRTHIQLTQHPLKYRGWIAQYLNRFELIDYLANKVYQNGGPLFTEWMATA